MDEMPQEALQGLQPTTTYRQGQDDTVKHALGLAKHQRRGKTSKDLEGAPAPAPAGLRSGAAKPRPPGPAVRRAGQVVGLLSASCSRPPTSWQDTRARGFCPSAPQQQMATQ